MQICYFYLTTILHWICPLVCSLCALALFDLRYQYVPSCQLLIAICCKNVQIKYGTQTHFCTCSKLFKMIQTSKLQVNFFRNTYSTLTHNITNEKIVHQISSSVHENCKLRTCLEHVEYSNYFLFYLTFRTICVLVSVRLWNFKDGGC